MYTYGIESTHSNNNFVQKCSNAPNVHLVIIVLSRVEHTPEGLWSHEHGRPCQRCHVNRFMSLIFEVAGKPKVSQFNLTGEGWA